MIRLNARTHYVISDTVTNCIRKSGMNSFRRHRILIVLILICIFCSTPNPLLAQEQSRVDKVEFRGNHAFSSGTLKEHMTLKGYGWIQDVLLGKDESVFDQNLLSADLNRITRFYQSEGYLHASLLTDDLDIDQAHRKVKIRVMVEEGVPILVRRVAPGISTTNTSDSLFVDSLVVSILSDLHLVLDKRFRDAGAHEDIATIFRLLADNGYPYAEVSPELTVDTTDNRVDITWQITTGPRCFFGSVVIEGNEHISTELIQKNVTVKPGRMFRQSHLNESQRNLIHLGAFEIATVTTAITHDKKDTIPVRVNLREAPWFSAKFGVGYGTEDKFRVFTNSRLLGILGGVRRLGLFAKHSDLEPYHVRLQLTQPAFVTRNTHLTVGPFIRRHDEPGFALQRLGLKTTIDNNFSSVTSASLGHTFERVDLDTSEVAESGHSLKGIDNLYNKSSILFGITYDGSSPGSSPNRGMFTAAIIKLSGLGFGSKYHFTRTLIDLRQYQKAMGIVLATRVQIGGINSHDDDKFVPIEDRFFAGGSSSVRGWARAMLGPKDDEGIPIGGKSLIEFSAELRYPIVGILSGVVFTDAGNIWLDKFSYDLDDLHYASGLGIRIATPIGPIRVDVARPIFDDDHDIQLHINVGQAF